jgi:hypothetical protein
MPTFELITSAGTIVTMRAGYHSRLGDTLTTGLPGLAPMTIFRPRTAVHRDKLVAWLQALDYAPTERPVVITTDLADGSVYTINATIRGDAWAAHEFARREVERLVERLGHHAKSAAITVHVDGKVTTVPGPGPRDNASREGR